MMGTLLRRLRPAGQEVALYVSPPVPVVVAPPEPEPEPPAEPANPLELALFKLAELGHAEAARRLQDDPAALPGLARALRFTGRAEARTLWETASRFAEATAAPDDYLAALGAAGLLGFAFARPAPTQGHVATPAPLGSAGAAIARIVDPAGAPIGTAVLPIRRAPPGFDAPEFYGDAAGGAVVLGRAEQSPSPHHPGSIVVAVSIPEAARAARETGLPGWAVLTRDNLRTDWWPPAGVREITICHGPADRRAAEVAADRLADRFNLFLHPFLAPPAPRRQRVARRTEAPA